MENVLVIIGLVLLMIALNCVMNVICFLIGAKIAQNVHKGEEIKLPSINPIEKIKDIREQREANKEQERVNIMLENINNYRGDSTGQKDIPS
jgi:hypothetical protein